MKKRILSVLIVIVLLATPAIALTYNVVGVGDSRPVMINGEQMTFPDVEPMSYAGRTLLPLRAVAEALGIPIDYVDGEVRIDTIDLEALKESCVEIYGTNTTNWMQGSGVYIDYDEILTCFHVVEGMHNLTVDDDYSVTLADTAKDKDAAILTVKQTDIKPVKIGDSDDVQVGDKVYIISAPNGEADTVTSGEVEYITTLDEDRNKLPVFFVMADTDGGSSGGACFNSNGELIGIVNGGSGEYTGITPINDVRKALAA